MNQSNKILLIDDDKDVLEFLSYNLIKVGFQVNICLSSNEAIEQINLFKPDLIILDIVMNGIDGIELCEMIRSKNTFNHILIVFFSVRTEDYSKIAALEAGADDYIVKPIKPNTIEPMKIITFHVLWHFTHVPFPVPRANCGLLHLAHNRLP